MRDVSEQAVSCPTERSSTNLHVLLNIWSAGALHIFFYNIVLAHHAHLQTAFAKSGLLQDSYVFSSRKLYTIYNSNNYYYHTYYTSLGNQIIYTKYSRCMYMYYYICTCTTIYVHVLLYVQHIIQTSYVLPVCTYVVSLYHLGIYL